MNRKSLNENMVITNENIFPIVEQNCEQIKENKKKIDKIDLKLWLIIVLIASTLGTNVINLIYKVALI